MRSSSATPTIPKPLHRKNRRSGRNPNRRLFRFSSSAAASGKPEQITVTDIASETPEGQEGHGAQGAVRVPEDAVDLCKKIKTFRSGSGIRETQWFGVNNPRELLNMRERQMKVLTAMKDRARALRKTDRAVRSPTVVEARP
jgi:hypothetical protein